VRRIGAAVGVALVIGLALVPGRPAIGAPARCGPVVTAPLAEAPWPLTRLRPDLVWPMSRGAGVTVAVIDSGVSADHPALAGQVLPGTDFVAPGAGDCDENGHGTLIAGIIAGRESTSGGFRFTGMAPEAKIVSVRVLRDQRRSSDPELSGRIASAIRWAVDVGRASVLNLSLTTPSTPVLADAVGYALARGAVVVAAAGNEGDNGAASYPAAYNGVLAVAGVDTQDGHVGSSTTGDYLDVAAPGARIAGPAAAGGGYLFSEEGGTSFATAYVSGVAALIRGYQPDLTPAQVAQRITETADHPAELWNNRVGYGVVNPRQAVGALPPTVRQNRQPQTKLDRPAAADDPLARVRTAAVGIGAAGSALALLLVLSVPVVRLGRRRGWRSGPG